MKHRYQINRSCKLLNKHKHIIGCWKRDSDKILLTHCKYTSLIWIYRWTAGRPAYNPPNWDRLGVYHGTVPEWAVRVDWRPGPPIWQRFGLDPDPDLKWQSGTIANSMYAVLGAWCTLCMLNSGCAVLGVCCTQCIPYRVSSVLCANYSSWHGQIESDNITIRSAIMAES